jgi:hypothetical protein
MFPSSGDGKETPTLLGPLERADLNHSLVLEFRAMGKVQTPSNTGCYAPTSESFRFYKF